MEGTGLGRWMGYDELVVVIGGDHVALLCACCTGMEVCFYCEMRVSEREESRVAEETTHSLRG